MQEVILSLLTMLKIRRLKIAQAEQIGLYSQNITDNNAISRVRRRALQARSTGRLRSVVVHVVNLFWA